jgi:hypothetical protein
MIDSCVLGFTEREGTEYMIQDNLTCRTRGWDYLGVLTGLRNVVFFRSLPGNHAANMDRVRRVNHHRLFAKRSELTRCGERSWRTDSSKMGQVQHRNPSHCLSMIFEYDLHEYLLRLLTSLLFHGTTRRLSIHENRHRNSISVLYSPG